jgi:hypothetical protein
VRCYSGLIICGPATEEPTVAFCRLKRTRKPKIRCPGRLDIVMRIEQDGGRPGRPWRLAEDSRMRAVWLEQTYSFEARLFKPGTGLFGGSANLAWIVGFVAVSAYRWYGNEVFQACLNVSEYRLN